MAAEKARVWTDAEFAVAKAMHEAGESIDSIAWALNMPRSRLVNRASVKQPAPHPLWETLPKRQGRGGGPTANTGVEFTPEQLAAKTAEIRRSWSADEHWVRRHTGAPDLNPKADPRDQRPAYDDYHPPASRFASWEKHRGQSPSSWY